MITLISIADSAYLQLLEISFQGKIDYCKRHGYEMPIGAEFGKANEWSEWNRPASWWKIWFLMEAIGTCKSEFLFWSDADSLIANPEIDLERFIPGPQQHFTMGVIPMNGNVSLCCGNFLVRQSPEAHRLLERIWGMYDQFKDDGLWEQAAFTHLWHTDDDVRRMIHVLPRHWLDCWTKPGDFIAHFGRENGTIEQRADKMRSFLERTREGGAT